LARIVIHLIRVGERWNLEQEGEVIATFPNKREGLEAGSRRSYSLFERGLAVDFIVYRDDGSIEVTNSYDRSVS
jgi:hypothetical protein